MSDMEMQVTLKLRDQLSAESAEMLETLRKGISATVTAFVQSATASQDSGRAAVEAGKASQTAAVRATAAVRQQTTATASATQATRALASATAEAKTRAEGMSKALRDLGYRDRNILGVAERIRQVDQYARRAEQGLLGAARAAGRMGQAVVRGGAALAAGGRVVGQALSGPVAYENSLADMANTAYADKGKAGRQAGELQLHGAIQKAWHEGGGSDRSATEAMKALIDSKAVSTNDAMSMLPKIQKAATAANVAPVDLAKVVVSGIKQKFIRPDQVGKALDMFIASDRTGGSQLQDLAHRLPQVMENAPGARSLGGFGRILTAVQADAAGTGGGEQSGEGLTSLMRSLNNQGTIQDFQKRHLDLSGAFDKTGNGTLSVDSFAQIVDQRVMGNDKRFQALKMRAMSPGGDPAATNAMVDMLQGSAVGKQISDREALRALVTQIIQRNVADKTMAAINQSDGAAQTGWEVKKDTIGYKIQQAQNEKNAAAFNLLQAVHNPLAGALDAVNGLAQRFPGLATAAYAATTALSALGASAGDGLAWGGLVGAGQRLFGGGAAAGMAGAAGVPTSRLGRLGGLFGLGTAALSVYDTETNANLTRAQKNAQHVGTAAGTVGGWGGAVLGAKAGAVIGGVIGTAVPIIGTAAGMAVGAAGGAILGGFYGSKYGSTLGQKAGDVLFGGGQTVIRNEIKLVADGRQLAAVVNEVNARQAQRH